MKLIILLLIFFILGCNSQKTNTSTITLQDSVKEESSIPTEKEILSPLIDSSKIYGIGILKIGTSEDQILSYFKSKSYKFSSVDNFMALIRQTNLSIYRNRWIVQDKNLFIKISAPKSVLSSDRIDNTYWCSDISTYYLPHYKVDKLDVENCYIIFYKNKLVKIKCYHSTDLEDAFEAKYGKADEVLKDTSGYVSIKWNNAVIETNFWSLDFEKYPIEGTIKIKNIDDFLHPRDSICESNHLKDDQNKLKSDSKEL